MAYTDVRGLAVSTTSADALAAYERGIDLFLRWREGAADAFQAAVAADPHFVLGHCTRAYVAWRMGKPGLAREAHQQLMALADDAPDERERLHVRAVDAMQRCDAIAAQTHLEQVAASACGCSASSASPRATTGGAWRSRAGASPPVPTTCSSRP